MCVCVCVCVCVCETSLRDGLELNTAVKLRRKNVFTFWKGEEFVVRIESLQNYNFVCCFVWV